MKANKNFNVIISNTEITNKKAVNITSKAASNDAKHISIMYYVNQLNKLYRKNEYVDNTNICDFGKMVHTLHTGKEPYTAYLFVKDSNSRPCYKVISKKCPKWGYDIVDVSPKGWEYLRPVTMSLSGLITAYRYILAPYALEQDKVIRAEQKAINEKIRKAKNEARKALKAEQEQARTDFNIGKIDIATFAAIMAKAI